MSDCMLAWVHSMSQLFCGPPKALKSAWRGQATHKRHFKERNMRTARHLGAGDNPASHA